MSTTSTCLQCGALLPGHAAAWLCPKCLLQQAATAPEMAESPSTQAEGAGAEPKPGAFPTVLHYFGDYELIQEIARGGMGVVYKARQISLNRTVAVKMLLFGKLAGQEFAKRFHTEAEAAASLQHPNIVSIHEIGEHVGQQYFSMDYVEGSNLAEFAAKNPIPPRRAGEYLQKVAQAIHYAHQRGILHRDLKPSNILIDTNGQPRITDFGLAKVMHRDSDLTVTGQILGSPHYMPPEQAGGKRDQTTVGSDVYSLGAILYHLLAGRPPFVAESIEATLSALVQNDPIPPRLLKPTIPRDLETICLKCLSKESKRRYGSAQELADELGRFLANEPILARPITAGEKVWRWCRRKPGFAGALAACLSLVIALAIGSPIALYRINRARYEAESEATRAYLAEGNAEANLQKSYLEQARALRTGSTVSRRYQAIEAISNAARFATSIDLRNEAVANLAQVDVRIASVYPCSYLGKNEIFDSSFTLAAVQSSRREVEVRHAFSRDVVGRLRVPDKDVDLLRKFSPDKRYLELVTSDATCIWGLVEGRFVLSNLPRQCAGDFSPDGTTFAIGMGNGGISVIDLATQQEQRRIGDQLPNRGLRYDPSGKMLACWDHYRLEILNLIDGERVRLRFSQSAGHANVRALAASGRVEWSADGQLLCGGFDRHLYVWRVSDGQLVQALPGHGAPIIGLSMSPSGEWITTASFDETTRIWEVQTGRLMTTILGSGWYTAFSRDNRFVAPIRLFTNNCVLELVRPLCFRRFVPPLHMLESQQVHDMSFSPDGRLAAITAWDGVRVWDCRTGRFLAALSTGATRTGVFEPDGTALLVSAEGEVSRWPLKYLEEAGTTTLLIGPAQNIGLPGGAWSSAALQPQSGKLAVASEYRRAAITSLGATTNWVRLEKVQPRAHHIDISPDGRFVATGTWGGSGVKVWDAQTGKLLHEHTNMPYSYVAFSTDGRWLVAGGDQYEAVPVGQWTRWQVVSPASGEHGLGVMAFSPDGRLLARLKSNTSYELVEPGTWRSVAVLQSPYPFQLSVPRFSHDGTLLGAADSTLGVQIWDLRQLRAELRAIRLDWDHPSYPPASSNLATNTIVARVLTQ